MNRQILEDILMQEDVVKSIRDNYDSLIDIIPEIESMVGFDHKHPHHHLDVFEHTLLALSRAPHDFEIRLVLLLHDIGKPYSCQEGEVRHFKGHPLVSCNMSNEILKRLNFNDEEIKELCYLIKEHDSLISEKDINDNFDLVYKRFKIQFCDGLAHHPDKLEKRIKYLLEMNFKINKGLEKENYDKELNALIKSNNR